MTMNDDKADEIIEQLGGILTELQELRTNFDEFTGYNTMKMSDAVDNLGDRITGGMMGIGGENLDDVVRALQSVESAVDLK